MKKYFALSFEYAKSLKPKPTTKKKAAKKAAPKKKAAANDNTEDAEAA